MKRGILARGNRSAVAPCAQSLKRRLWAHGATFAVKYAGQIDTSSLQVSFCPSSIGLLHIIISGSGTSGQIGDGIVYHLGYLSPGRVVPRPEVLAWAWLTG